LVGCKKVQGKNVPLGSVPENVPGEGTMDRRPGTKKTTDYGVRTTAADGNVFFFARGFRARKRPKKCP